MKSSGVIYSYTRVKRLTVLGRFLIFSALGVLLYLFLPIGMVELRYQMQKNEEPAVAVVEERNPVPDEAAAHGLSSYFSIFIPKIDARATITPNVSLTDFQDALTRGVAHAEGTYFPGQGKGIYLFAHSTDSPLNFARYNAVFYLLNRMAHGDRIVLYFLNQKYVYEVQTTVIAQANDTSWLSRDFGTESLILQTCDPPGTQLRRLLVIATRVM
jgi:LPXTG-site transpeptidase (sortase) family protein